MCVQKVLKGLKLHRIHDSLSKVTETRKKCMPFEGTFDFWVLSGITIMNLIAVGIGFYKLEGKKALLTVKGCQAQNVQLIALVFAFIEATPGLLFLMCAPRAMTCLPCVLPALQAPGVMRGQSPERTAVAWHAGIWRWRRVRSG
jgi:hypothetical protein